MPKRTVHITKHAQERASQRCVTLEQIKETISNPTQKGPKQVDGTQEFKRTVGDRTHYVIIEEKKDCFIVITTWWKNE